VIVQDPLVRNKITAVNLGSVANAVATIQNADTKVPALAVNKERFEVQPCIFENDAAVSGRTFHKKVRGELHAGELPPIFWMAPLPQAYLPGLGIAKLKR